MTAPAARPLPSSAQIAEAVRGLSIRVHETARRRGFYLGGTRNVPEALGLAALDLGRAARDIVKARKPSDIGRTANGKPCGFGPSLAKAVIRICDICEYAGVDLGKEVAAEMERNEQKAAKRG